MNRFPRRDPSKLSIFLNQFFSFGKWNWINFHKICIRGNLTILAICLISKISISPRFLWSHQESTDLTKCEYHQESPQDGSPIMDVPVMLVTKTQRYQHRVAKTCDQNLCTIDCNWGKPNPVEHQIWNNPMSTIRCHWTRLT